MSYKEILAIVLAVIAICAVVALTKLVRGTGNENSGPEEITTVSAPASTTVTTSYWDKLRQERESSSTSQTVTESNIIKPVTTVGSAQNSTSTTAVSDSFVTDRLQPAVTTSANSFTTTSASSTTTTAAATERQPFYTIIVG